MLVTGCTMATVGQPPGSQAPVSTRAFPSETAIESLATGLSRPEVQTILGPELAVGYERYFEPGTTDPKYRTITVKNPYRSETLTKNKRTLQVDYYLTHVRQSNGEVSDDELTPLIFENNRLLGKSWEELNKLR